MTGSGAAMSNGDDADAMSIVASVWSQVLEVDSIDNDVDFFSLGGDSRAAAEVIVRLREEFAMPSLPLMLIFECPSVSMLSEAIDELRGQRTR